MQSAPVSIDLKNLKTEIEKINGVKNLHHVHLWSMNDRQIHFEGHVDLEQDLPVSQASKLNRQISQLLNERYEIEHTTLQMEYGCCHENELIHKT
jgi:cobalt-zinc-cadmium efflux system protein